MQNQNMTDVIEQYLKALLESARQVEISRSDVAEHFNCVPSQINYVIKTRFTPQQGYVVESKRGGGGYIRILKVQVRSDGELLKIMRENVPDYLHQRDSQRMIQQLYDAGLVDRQCGNAMAAALSHQTLACGDRNAEMALRSRLFLAFLDSLLYER